MRSRARRVAVSWIIREYGPADAADMQLCVAALQDFERAFDPRLRPGSEIAAEYCDQLHARCRATGGRVFVAELNGHVVGFVAVRAQEPFTELDDPPGTYALVSVLSVLPPYRRRGIGRRLLSHAESFAPGFGATELRIGVLSGNTPARQLYLSSGFRPHLETLAKNL